MLRSFRSVFFQIMPRNAITMTETTKMKSLITPSAVSALLLAASLGYPAVAQSSSTAPAQSQSAQVQTGTSANPNDNSTYATGQPLSTKSNEGFWGKVNPFARKKW
jgi:hypothetical protein